LLAAAHAHLAFYEAAAQVIPILLLTLAVGESRIKPRSRGTPLVAIGSVAAFGGCIIAGELAALRVLSLGHDSEALHSLTVLSLMIGLAFLLKYLAWAAYREVAGPEAEPSAAVANALPLVTLLAGVATLFFLWK
jgi:hypothetical protein